MNSTPATMLRLRQICLVAAELRRATGLVKAVFGLKECHRDANVVRYGLENVCCFRSVPILSKSFHPRVPARRPAASSRAMADATATWSSWIATTPSAGGLRIGLDSGGINFLPSSVPEPVLAGIELLVVERDRVLDAANTRGCLTSNGTVEVCGMRFRLTQED